MKFFKLIDKSLQILHYPIWIFLAPIRLINKFISSPKAVTVIKLAAMGDIICLYPSISNLHRKGYKVTLVTTTRSNPQLFESCEAIHEIILLDFKIKQSFKSIVRIFYNILCSRFCINADQYYNLSKLLSYISSESIGFETEKNKQCYKFPTKYSYVENEKLQFFKLANKITYLDERQLLSNDVFDHVKHYSENFLFKDAVLLHPGSGPTAQIRRWPLENWVKLYFELTHKGWKCKFIGGPEEVEIIPYLVRKKVPMYNIHINSFKLTELIDAMRCCRAFIGNDAGLFHVADGLGVPLLGIFGPNISSKWGSIRKLSAHVEIELPCRPCIVNVEGKIPNFCRIGTLKCLNDITTHYVEAVLENLVKKL